jgi:hypothetical protein
MRVTLGSASWGHSMVVSRPPERPMKQRAKVYETMNGTLKLDRSPCVNCHRKNEDKNRCAPICKRLDAFRRGNDYSGLPIPEEAAIWKPGHSTDKNKKAA